MTIENGAGGSDSLAGGEIEKKEESVSYETYKKLVEQRKSDQRKAQEMAAKLAEYEASQKAAEEKALSEQNKWKELAEKAQLERDEAKKEKESLYQSIENAEKIEAFEAAIGARLAHPSFKAHINLGAIAIDANGEIDLESLNSEIKRFTETYGNSLLKQQQITTPPAGKANPPAQKGLADMTPAERAALRRELLKK